MKNLIKKYDEKGFTLMEMLIVVAIIAILVAIAFPIFNKQLNNARVATDAANIRSGYAVATSMVLEKSDALKEKENYLQKDRSVGKETNAYTTQGEAKKDDDVVKSLGSCGITDGWEKGAKVTYTYNGDKVTAKVA